MTQKNYMPKTSTAYQVTQGKKSNQIKIFNQQDVTYAKALTFGLSNVQTKNIDEVTYLVYRKLFFKVAMTHFRKFCFLRHGVLQY